MEANAGTSPFSSRRISKAAKMNLKEQMNLLGDVNAQEMKLVKGDLDLDENLKKTDAMYSQINRQDGINQQALCDSQLLYKQSDIIHTKAKNLQTNSRCFVALEFAEKMKNYASKNKIIFNKRDDPSEPWTQLGDMFKTKIHSTPSFHFMYGSFIHGPVEFKKRSRIVKAKDVIGEQVTLKSLNLTNSQGNQDITIQEVERILNILMRLYKKHDYEPICYFGFITDPDSFSRTVEYMFYVSFLVREGAVKLVNDQDNLPGLVPVDKKDCENNQAVSYKQSVLSMSVEDWKNIIKTYN